MLTIAKPIHGQLQEFLWKQQDLPFTYAEVGATKSGPAQIPHGYTCGHNRDSAGFWPRLFRCGEGSTS